MLSSMLFSPVSATLKFLIEKNRIDIREFRYDRMGFQRSQNQIHKGGSIIHVSAISVYLSSIYTIPANVF